MERQGWFSWKAFFVGWLAAMAGAWLLDLLVARTLGVFRTGPFLGLLACYLGAYLAAPRGKHANAIVSVLSFVAAGVLLVWVTVVWLGSP